MLAILDRRGRILSLVSGARLALLLTELGALIALVTIASLVAPSDLIWPAAPIIALGSVAMIFPDSEAGLLTLMGFGGWWLVADRSASWAAIFVAALAALVFHLSLAHAAAAPSGARMQPAVVASAMADAGLVALATGVAVGVAALLEGSGVRAPAFMVGAALVLVGLLPWMASLRGNRR